MKWMQFVRGSVVTLASLGLLCPQSVLAAFPSAGGAAAPITAVRDVTLQDDGSLRGHVLDSQGQPFGNVQVSVVQQGKLVQAVQSDDAGRFAISGLRGGLYQLATEQGVAVYRVWTPHTAPPSAGAEALLIHQGTLVRGGAPLGGGYGGGVLGFLSNPWVLGGIVAAAIAIPLALDDDDDAS
jgi:hypothetical protein